MPILGLILALFAREQKCPAEGPDAIDRIDTVGAFPLKLKLSSRKRPLSAVWGVTCHVTAVNGGFGISAGQIRRARSGADTQRLALVAHLPDGQQAKALALLERYSRNAYHHMGSRAFGGMAIRQHPASLRTSHGHGGNRGLGWALDCGGSEELSEVLIRAGIVSLENCIAEAHAAAGRRVPIWGHRAFSSRRLRDPGPKVWTHIVKPTAERMREKCYLDYETAERGGRPPGADWDRDALFDAKGRRL